MEFALVNGSRAEAQPGLQGTCAFCQSDTFARCGTERIWHWAHKGKCDPWREEETAWHRAWKKHFPEEWREITHTDSTTGERHIADIKTDKEFVIEFQHSAIKSSELQSREAFYKNMVWVVDGTRLSMDYRRFCKGSNDFNSGEGCVDSRSSIWNGVFSTYFPEECFPKRWLTSSVPVYVDFQGIAPDQPDEKRAVLWCLLPGDAGGRVVVARLGRKDFIEAALTASHLLLAQDIRSRMEQQRAKEKEHFEEAKWRENQRAEAFRQWWINPGRGYRRF